MRLSEKVFVAVKVEREVSKAAMVWALTHVVRPGDSITLLALLASRRQPWKFIHFSR